MPHLSSTFPLTNNHPFVRQLAFIVLNRTVYPAADIIVVS